MKGELMVFRNSNMVIAYNDGGPDRQVAARQLPGYLTMPKEDQRLLEEALDNGKVILYFLKDKRIDLAGKKMSCMESPMYGKIVVLDETNGKEGMGHFNVEEIGGTVASFPTDMLPFLFNALSTIKAAEDAIMRPKQLSDDEARTLGRILRKGFGIAF